MKRNLTDQFVESIKPTPGKRIEIQDTRQAGFSVRVTPTGAKSFSVFYRFNGKQCRLTLGSFPKHNVESARKAATVALAKVITRKAVTAPRLLREQPKMRTYFVRCEETGKIKIGKSTGVQERVRHLQTANPSRLTLLHVIDGDLETELHARFSQYRVRYDGEWFHPASEILEFIEAKG